MLNADRAPYFLTCPRCKEGGYEKFRTHTYCVNCNFSIAYDPEELVTLPDWVEWALAYPLSQRGLKTEGIPQDVNQKQFLLDTKNEDSLAS